MNWNREWAKKKKKKKKKKKRERKKGIEKLVRMMINTKMKRRNVLQRS